MNKLRYIIREEIRKLLKESVMIKFIVPPQYSKYLKDKVIANLLKYIGTNGNGDIVIGIDYKDRDTLKKRLKTVKWSEVI